MLKHTLRLSYSTFSFITKHQLVLKLTIVMLLVLLIAAGVVFAGDGTGSAVCPAGAC